mmetsp:Transcript_1785/g.4561  ORF Transcript_1785/g.4561 Transcript_1785/m.4561 type:complete len:253 (-) Transcript_1785:224-982(-)
MLSAHWASLRARRCMGTRLCMTHTGMWPRHCSPHSGQHATGRPSALHSRRWACSARGQSGSRTTGCVDGRVCGTRIGGTRSCARPRRARAGPRGPTGWAPHSLASTRCQPLSCSAQWFPCTTHWRTQRALSGPRTTTGPCARCVAWDCSSRRRVSRCRLSRMSSCGRIDGSASPASRSPPAAQTTPTAKRWRVSGCGGTAATPTTSASCATGAGTRSSRRPPRQRPAARVRSHVRSHCGRRCACCSRARRSR